MISRKAKKLVLAREQLQTLTPAELTEVSGGGKSTTTSATATTTSTTPARSTSNSCDAERGRRAKRYALPAGRFASGRAASRCQADRKARPHRLARLLFRAHWAGGTGPLLSAGSPPTAARHREVS